MESLLFASQTVGKTRAGSAGKTVRSCRWCVCVPTEQDSNSQVTSSTQTLQHFLCICLFILYMNKISQIRTNHHFSPLLSPVDQQKDLFAEPATGLNEPENM